ncbi:hypothetical protein Barb6XT_02914 [Bacteroidales bacterium Barb6XT]|nr:hypothetical protein Barb6XT_02914 [Bacteroidales bacterium Barb6XT]
MTNFLPPKTGLYLFPSSRFCSMASRSDSSIQPISTVCSPEVLANILAPKPIILPGNRTVLNSGLSAKHPSLTELSPKCRLKSTVRSRVPLKASFPIIAIFSPRVKSIESRSEPSKAPSLTYIKLGGIRKPPDSPFTSLKASFSTMNIPSNTRLLVNLSGANSFSFLKVLLVCFILS